MIVFANYSKVHSGAFVKIGRIKLDNLIQVKQPILYVTQCMNCYNLFTVYFLLCKIHQNYILWQQAHISILHSVLDQALLAWMVIFK